MSIYPYAPLDANTETRLLTIEPGEWDEDIVCHLAHVSISIGPEYEALSYVWGHSIIGDLNDLGDDLDREIYVWNYVMRHPTRPVSEIEKIRIPDAIDHPIYRHTYYAGGGPRPSRSITIDGIEIVVGGELFCALKRLRHQHRLHGGQKKNRLVLWVDAVCINQNDNEEKSKHVKSMGRIYAGARTVRIWLGDEVSDSERRAFDAIDVIATILGETLEKSIDRETARQAFLTNPKIVNLPWDSVSSLLKRAWFERVWVIQEIANAKKAFIHIGRKAWDWTYFASVFKALRHLDVDIFFWSHGEFTAATSIAMMDRLRTFKNQDDIEARPHFPLVNILLESRHFKSTLASDKIYGVLDLASDGYGLVEPDYSTPPAEVFKNFAVSYITTRGNIDLLYCCIKPRKESYLTLPSWVPDWTQPCHHNLFTFTGYGSHASRKTDPAFRFANDNQTLFVRGKYIDKIEAVEKTRRIPRHPSEDLPLSAWTHSIDGTPAHIGPDILGSQHNAWRDDLNENARLYMRNIISIAYPDQKVTPETFEALWRSFVCNKRIDQTVPPPEWGQHFSDFMANLTTPKSHRAARYEQIARVERNPYDLRESVDNRRLIEEKERGLMEFTQAYGLWCYNRRFLKTQAGRFGWGVDTTEPGDVICVLYGASIPFILRPVGGGCFEVVGDCYVHEFMDGEAMTDDIEECEFHLV